MVECAHCAPNGPNHLGLRYNAPTAHQLAVITSGCWAAPSRRIWVTNFQVSCELGATFQVKYPQVMAYSFNPYGESLLQLQANQVKYPQLLTDTFNGISELVSFTVVDVPVRALSM